MGFPISVRWSGGEHERFRNNFPNRPFGCGCNYGHTGFVLNSGCAIHVSKVVRVSDYDKKRRVDPLWKPNG
jgi:hypothetical protein